MHCFEIMDEEKTEEICLTQTRLLLTNREVTSCFYCDSQTIWHVAQEEY